MDKCNNCGENPCKCTGHAPDEKPKSDYFYDEDGEKYLYPGRCICTEKEKCLYHKNIPDDPLGIMKPDEVTPGYALMGVDYVCKGCNDKQATIDRLTEENKRLETAEGLTFRLNDLLDYCVRQFDMDSKKINDFYYYRTRIQPIVKQIKSEQGNIAAFLKEGE